MNQALPKIHIPDDFFNVSGKEIKAEQERKTQDANKVNRFLRSISPSLAYRITNSRNARKRWYSLEIHIQIYSNSCSLSKWLHARRNILLLFLKT